MQRLDFNRNDKCVGGSGRFVKEEKEKIFHIEWHLAFE
ncbi:hypothetical protein RU98_GL000017 [Enterococcus caccae]|nr:hypothetical protein RU98_GL000017 [Enterococcus caccae]